MYYVYMLRCRGGVYYTGLAMGAADFVRACAAQDGTILPEDLFSEHVDPNGLVFFLRVIGGHRGVDKLRRLAAQGFEGLLVAAEQGGHHVQPSLLRQA